MISNQWREVRSKVQGIRIYQLNIEKREGGKLISAIGQDEVYIEVQENWGNRIYTNKAGANKVYRAFLSGELTLSNNSFKTINNIRQYLEVGGTK